VNVYDFAFDALGVAKNGSHYPSHPGSPLGRPGLTSVSFMNARLHSDWPSNHRCLLPVTPISIPKSTFANSTIAPSIPHKTPCHTKYIVWLSRHIEPRPVGNYLSGVANNLEFMLPRRTSCMPFTSHSHVEKLQMSALKTCSSEISCQSRQPLPDGARRWISSIL
jgi:hypothetical protein